jgi:hypothetical protein
MPAANRVATKSHENTRTRARCIFRVHSCDFVANKKLPGSGYKIRVYPCDLPAGIGRSVACIFVSIRVLSWPTKNYRLVAIKSVSIRVTCLPA